MAGAPTVSFGFVWDGDILAISAAATRRSHRWAILLACGLLAAGSVWRVSPLRAQSDDVQAAARAFEEGQRAQLQQQYARAAQFFEIAHRAAPAPAAIRAAIRNHRAAGALPRAATLALVARTDYADDAETTALTQSVLEEAETTLAQAQVVCATPCTVSIDGRLATLAPIASVRVFVSPGAHEVSTRFGEATAPTQQWTRRWQTGLRASSRAASAR